jgi:pimeloyl-ACP methyl ester carboxylesterase
LDADIRKSLRVIYFSISGDGPERLWFVKKPKSAKFLEGLIDPLVLPRWLTVEDLDYYVEQYRKGGFRGPLNWYWNIDCNNELTPQLEKAKIEQPAFFITGKKDLVMSFPDEWFNQVDLWVRDLRGKVIIEGAGHWVQAVKPGPVNEALFGIFDVGKELMTVVL